MGWVIVIIRRTDTRQYNQSPGSPIGEGNGIHVDPPTGINCKTRAQIIATVEAMIFALSHSTSATAQAVSTAAQSPAPLLHAA